MQGLSARFAGSAASERSGAQETSTARTRLLSRRRIVRRAQPVAESHFEPRVDEYLSELIAETLGEHTFDFFLRNKRAEWADYRNQVSAFELDRYLPRL